MACSICNSNNLSKIITLSKVPKAAQYFVDSPNDKTIDEIDLTILQCNNCGHVQTGNKPVDYYRDVITASSLSPFLAKERVLYLKKIIRENKIEDPRIIEIGSHVGNMVKFISDNIKCKVMGIENCDESVNKSKKLGIIIKKGYLCEDVEGIKNEKFNIVVCFNFLEHMPNPSQFLNNLKLFLEDESYVYMTVPSLNFIESTSCIHEFISDHLSYFTENSLSNLFKINGYQVLDCKSIHNKNDLEIYARFSRPKKLNLDIAKYNLLKEKLNSMIEIFNNQNSNIVIWGAGHRSLTLISQINYKNINYIVDSAIFKQEKYAPVSRIEIVSPDILYSLKNVTLFLNLPGIYGEEVISNLDEKIKINITNLYNIKDNNLIKIN